jgi:hypothetical protein
MSEEQKKDKMAIPHELDKKRDTLYQNDFTDKEQSVSHTTVVPEKPKDSWKGENINSEKISFIEGVKKTSKTYVRLFSVLAGIFLLLSLAAVFYFFFYAERASIDKVFLQVVPPQNVFSGESSPIAVRIDNQNNVDLTNVTLVLREGSGSVARPVNRVDVGTVEKEEDFTAELLTTIIGQKNERKPYSLLAEFSLGDTSTMYRKEIEQTINIATAPLSIDVSMPKTALADETVSVNVEVTSNTNVDLENVSLQMIFSDAFEVDNVSPAFAVDDAWKFSIDALDKQSFTVTGRFLPQSRAEEEIIFVAEKLPDDDGDSLSQLARTTEVVAITRPPVALSLTVPRYLKPSSFREPIRLQHKVNAQNISSTELTNLGLTLTISGPLDRFAALESDSQNFLTNDFSLIWTRETLSRLNTIPIGKSVQTGAVVTIDMPIQSLQNNKNVELLYNLYATAGEIEDFRQGETIASIERSVKVLSDPYVLPAIEEVPELTAGRTAPFIIDLSVDGFRNDLQNVVITFELPVYTNFEQAETSLGKISFEPLTKAVVWEISELSSETVPTASVRLNVTPGPAQRGKVIPLTKNFRFTGVDTFVDTFVETNVAPIEVPVRG